MVRNGKGSPVLDQTWFLLQNSETRGGVTSQISHLNLQTGCFLHQLRVVRLKSQCILEAFGSFSKIFFSLVDGGTSMPAEHTLHLTLDQRCFGHIQSLCVFAQGLKEKGLQGVGLGMVGMRFQQFICILQSLLVIFGVVELLNDLRGTASRL